MGDATMEHIMQTKGIATEGDAVRAHFVTLCPVLLKLNQQLQDKLKYEVQQHNNSRDQAPASDNETSRNTAPVSYCYHRKGCMTPGCQPPETTVAMRSMAWASASKLHTNHPDPCLSDAVFAVACLESSMLTDG